MGPIEVNQKQQQIYHMPAEAKSATASFHPVDLSSQAVGARFR